MRERYLPYLLIIPAIVMIASLFVYPVAFNTWLMFFDIRGYSAGGFVGLQNFFTIITSATFQGSLLTTFIYVVVALAVELALGLALAMLCNEVTRGSGAIRTMMILPMMSTPVVVGLIFKLMLNPELGVVNVVARSLNLPTQLWLVNPNIALFALALVDVWQWTPLVTLILLAGLKSIPLTIYEAVAVDGASALDQFRRITLPLLRPTAAIALIFNSMRLLKAFDPVVMITKGGPGTSTNLVSYAIQQITVTYQQLSLGATATQVLLLIVGLVANIYVIYLRRTFSSQ